MRAVYFVLGLVCVALGFVGAFLPVLPTTPFLILAAACFARSSRRFETWLLDHKRFGPLLRQWRERGAIPRRAKWLALIGVTIGFVMFLSIAPQVGALASALVGLLMLSGLAYVFSRPS
jgi:uncharacterized membrane protein YbaN (DUF454 family)